MFEPVQAVSTLVGFLPRVNPHMGLQVGFPPEPSTALITLERLLSCVSSLVAAELLIRYELLRTETASFGVSISVVSLLVLVSHSLSVEPLTALRTHELLQVQMRFHMGLEGIFPIERLATLKDFTCKGLQPRMCSFPVSITA